MFQKCFQIDSKASTKFQDFWPSGNRVLNEFLISNIGCKNKV
jgi:hypothetical protein